MLNFVKMYSFCRFCCDSPFNFYFTVAFGSLCTSNADCHHHFHVNVQSDEEVYCHIIHSHIGTCQIRKSKYNTNTFLSNLTAAYEKRCSEKEKLALITIIYFFCDLYIYSTLGAMGSLGSL